MQLIESKIHISRVVTFYSVVVKDVVPRSSGKELPERKDVKDVLYLHKHKSGVV